MSELRRLLDPSNEANDPRSSSEYDVARGLLESAVDEKPPAGAEGRLREALGLPEGPPPVAPPRASLAIMKWVGLAVLVVGGAAFVRSMLATPSSDPRATSSAEPSTSIVALPSASSSAPSPIEPVPSSAPPAPLAAASSPVRAPAASASAIASSPPKPLSLRAELELLDAIRADLAGGNSTSALAKLDRYDREFQGGALADEAAVLRVEALLAHGDQARAEAFATRFLATHRGTPYESRIRTLLGR